MKRASNESSIFFSFLFIDNASFWPRFGNTDAKPSTEQSYWSVQDSKIVAAGSELSVCARSSNIHVFFSFLKTIKRIVRDKGQMLRFHITRPRPCQNKPWYSAILTVWKLLSFFISRNAVTKHVKFMESAQKRWHVFHFYVIKSMGL